MKKKTMIPRKKRGPLATGKGEPVVVRMQPPQLQAVDAWIAAQPQPFPSRPEAVRRLVELGLTVKTKSKQAVGAVRAKELATTAIDKMIDPSALPEEHAQRRRRITAGPSEFREDRVDLPKAKK